MFEEGGKLERLRKQKARDKEDEQSEKKEKNNTKKCEKKEKKKTNKDNKRREEEEKKEEKWEREHAICTRRRPSHQRRLVCQQSHDRTAHCHWLLRQHLLSCGRSLARREREGKTEGGERKRDRRGEREGGGKERGEN